MSTHEFYEHEFSDQEIRRIRDECRAFLREKRSDQAELVEEYISEAEHQDGDTYWVDYFGGQPEDAILADFDLYVASIREQECEAIQMGEFDLSSPERLLDAIMDS